LLLLRVLLLRMLLLDLLLLELGHVVGVMVCLHGRLCRTKTRDVRVSARSELLQ
jgi:hypothetical protein